MLLSSVMLGGSCPLVQLLSEHEQLVSDKWQIYWDLDMLLCFGSTGCYSVVSETVLYSTPSHHNSQYYRTCFWRQNYAFGNVSLKTHVFSVNVR